MARTPARSQPTAADLTAGLGAVDALAQLSFLIQGTLARRAAGRDLSIIQARLLGVLRDREPAMNELAKVLELDKSSVTGLVDRAVRRRLVERVPSLEDRRAARVRLTDTGRAVVNEAAAAFAADIAEIVSCLQPDERTALTALITRVLVCHAAASGIDIWPAPTSER